jgi:hypothetical protein
MLPDNDMIYESETHPLRTSKRMVSWHLDLLNPIDDDDCQKDWHLVCFTIIQHHHRVNIIVIIII